MTRAAAFTLGLFLLLVLAGVLLGRPPATATKLATLSDAGLSFRYPASYFAMNAAADRSIVLLPDTPENRRVAAGEEPGREYPPTISVTLYPKNGKPLREWIRSEPSSSFMLSNGALSSTTVAGVDAFSYDWDGLYRGRSVAMERGDFVVIFSVTAFEASDPIRADFDRVLSSVRTI